MITATSAEAFEYSGEVGTTGFGVLTGNANSDYSRGDIDASVELSFSDMFSAQIDVSATGYTGFQSEMSILSGGLHLSAHPNEKLSVGVFAYADTLYAYGVIFDASAVGIEGKYALEFSPNSIVDTAVSIGQVSLEGRSVTAYSLTTSSHLTDNVILNLDSGGYVGDIDGSYFGVGLGYEIAPEFTVSGRYVRQIFANGYNDAFGLALRYKFGKGSTFGNHQASNVMPGG